MDSFEVVPLPPGHFGDGSKSAWPKEQYWKQTDDRLYRQKLATMWMQKSGKLVRGEQYILDRLPDGYALLKRPRFSAPDIWDKFVYGHPSGACFNSPNQFFPHFYWPPGPKSVTVPMQSSRGRPLKNPKALPPRRPTDTEGTPDVFREAITKLKRLGEVDEPIHEHQSMDWRAGNKPIRENIVRLGLQGSYVPRVGEVVLWMPQLDGELRYDDSTGVYRVFSVKANRFMNIPKWRAGTIGQAPDKDPVVLADLIQPTSKEWAVNYSGFRVETFPDPNSDEKSSSLQYAYIHIHLIRPFYSWPIWLMNVPEKDWHSSIKYAMTVMSSFSLVDKYHFSGEWPDASVDCRGMFLGPEMIIAGDAVRLKPAGASLDTDLPSVTDVMVIDRIQFKLISCIDDAQSPLLAEKHQVRVRGKVYTLSPVRAYHELGEYGPPPLSRHEVINAFQQTSMTEYGPWYRAHKIGTLVEVSQDMIIGRCYEPSAMELVFGKTALNFDLAGMLASRDWARRADNRLHDDQHWFWADYRTQALGIDTLNGEDVGRYSDARNCKMWKAVLNILDGTASKGDYDAAKLPRRAGRPLSTTKDKSQFAEIGKMSTLVTRALHIDTSANVSSNEDVDNTTSSEDEGGDMAMAIDYRNKPLGGGSNGDNGNSDTQVNFSVSLPIRVDSVSPQKIKRPRLS
ncbi:Cryptic loci regulator 2 [Talaromyces islandicus]|uniref:Cryptic loci regulator 2 n=1 Tax=Talaromyces islandicus TaxID=28573 RepID=A0A0U1M5N5_TALIS|nr:Cryptic loci regulator 2 [Talaromyces islandicus]